MEISWKDNLKKKVRLAYFGGKPVKSIYLNSKQLYPDASAASVLALRPMNASEGGDYPQWAWLMDIMKNSVRYSYYEFIVVNETDLNGGRDFKICAKSHWSSSWGSTFAGSFDPETFLLECYSNEMKVWAGLQEVGKKIKVKLRNAENYEKNISLDPIWENNNTINRQIELKLPYIYSAVDMSGEESEGRSLGLNFRFRAMGRDFLFFSYYVRVMGNPSGTTHLYGNMLVLQFYESPWASGGRPSLNDLNGNNWTPYEDPKLKLEWQKGDTGMVIEIKNNRNGGVLGWFDTTKLWLDIFLPANEEGKYYNWDAVIEKKA